MEPCLFENSPPLRAKEKTEKDETENDEMQLSQSVKSIDLILMKNTKHRFELDVSTEKQENGRIKVSVGFDKVK